MVAPFFLQSNKLSPDRLTNLPKDTQQVASRHRLWAKAIWVWVCTVNHQARPYEHGEHPSFSFICVMLVVNATPDTSQGLHIYPISRYDWIRTSPGNCPAIPGCSMKLYPFLMVSRIFNQFFSPCTLPHTGNSDHMTEANDQCWQNNSFSFSLKRSKYILICLGEL